MTIALSRRPESAKAFFFGLGDERALSPAIDLLRQVLQRLPGLVGGVNLMNRHRVLAMATPFPREHTGPDGMLTDIGVAHLARKYRIAAWTVFGTLYGTRHTVRAAQMEIRRLVGSKARGLLFVSPAGATRLRRLAGVLPTKSGAALAQRTMLLESSLNFVVGRPSEAALALAYWKSGRSRSGPKSQLDPSRDGCGVIWYTPLVVMKADVVTRYVAFVTETMQRHRIEPLISLTTLSERCFDSSVPILFDRDDPAAVLRAKTCYRALLDEGAREGFVPYRVGIGAMEWLVRPGIVAWDLVADIKRALDPFGIISPGRYAPSSPGR